jgi:catalase
MTPQQAEAFRYNVLDLTKVWPHKDYPLRPIGKVVLDENPQNYFAEIEQAAFSPFHIVPGIEPSADPVLQSQLFSYPDTHRHCLGVNYQQFPVNAPFVPVVNFQHDGPATFVSQGARPNYQSTILPLTYRLKPYSGKEHKHEVWAGHARTHLYDISERECDNRRYDTLASDAV